MGDVIGKGFFGQVRKVPVSNNSSKENLNADTCFASDINSARSGKIEEEPAQLLVVEWPNVIGESTDKQ